MADKQYDISPAEKRAFIEKQAQRKSLREYYMKHASNPYRHATGEGGMLFDAGLFRHQAMRVKEYEFFRPTPKSGIQAFMLTLGPILLLSYIFKTTRDAREKRFRSGEVAYKDREFKMV